MTGTLYTIGYVGLSPERLARLVPAGALVVDVRLKRYSGYRAWSLNTEGTFAGLGIEYLYLPALGNLAYKTGGIQIADIDAIQTVLDSLAYQDVVLLCVCANVAICHRLTLANEAARRDPTLEVVHLQADAQTAGLGL